MAELEWYWMFLLLWGMAFLVLLIGTLSAVSGGSNRGQLTVTKDRASRLVRR